MSESRCHGASLCLSFDTSVRHEDCLMDAATGEESTETQITLNKNKYISQFHHKNVLFLFIFLVFQFNISLFNI